MIDERFLHPLCIFDFQTGRIQIAFRKRNHMIPCTTRRLKTMRKAVRRYPILRMTTAYADVDSTSTISFEQAPL